jgi:polyvinyl alcohol dehydrogenase (cytochrome)
LWEYETVREFETVNGVKAKGGSTDGPDPVVVNGMLYWKTYRLAFGQ